MANHVFRRTIGHKTTFKAPRRSRAAGFVFVLTLLTVVAQAFAIDGVWYRRKTPDGWIVETARAGTVYIVDKKHAWSGSVALEALPDGGVRMATPEGWIVEGMSGGAVYFADAKHKWNAWDGIVIPPPTPPPPSPTPSPTPTTTPSDSPTPTPTASPTPTPSTPPVFQGFTRPLKTENMVETAPDVWQTTVNAFADQQAGVLQFQIDMKPGDVLDVDYDRAIYIPGGWTSKIKFYRAWSRSIGGTYNFYFGSDNGSYAFVWVEFAADVIRWVVKLPSTDGKEHHEHYRFAYPSATGKSDGAVAYDIDSKSAISAPSTATAADKAHPGARWKLDGPVAGMPNIHCIQIDTPSWNPASNSFMKVRNIQYRLNGKLLP